MMSSMRVPEEDEKGATFKSTLCMWQRLDVSADEKQTQQPEDHAAATNPNKIGQRELKRPSQQVKAVSQNLPASHHKQFLIPVTKPSRPPSATKPSQASATSSVESKRGVQEQVTTAQRQSSNGNVKSSEDLNHSTKRSTTTQFVTPTKTPIITSSLADSPVTPVVSSSKTTAATPSPIRTADEVKLIVASPFAERSSFWKQMEKAHADEKCAASSTVSRTNSFSGSKPASAHSSKSDLQPAEAASGNQTGPHKLKPGVTPMANKGSLDVTNACHIVSR